MERHIKLSENEEMYLVVIAKLNERDGGGPVALAKVAHELAILPVSANQMVRKLEKIGLVSYAPYKGVELTESGSLIASRILRQRRLWEVFLVEHLYLMSTEAEELWDKIKDHPELNKALSYYERYINALVYKKFKQSAQTEKIGRDLENDFYNLTTKERKKALKDMEDAIKILTEHYKE